MRNSQGVLFNQTLFAFSSESLLKFSKNDKSLTQMNCRLPCAFASSLRSLSSNTASLLKNSLFRLLHFVARLFTADSLRLFNLSAFFSSALFRCRFWRRVLFTLFRLFVFEKICFFSFFRTSCQRLNFQTQATIMLIAPPAFTAAELFPFFLHFQPESTVLLITKPGRISSPTRAYPLISLRITTQASLFSRFCCLP